jgi:hypothetical protein
VVNRYTDDELQEVISNIVDFNDLSGIDLQARNLALRKIKGETGASIRQLERVIGIGRNIIQKA